MAYVYKRFQGKQFEKGLAMFAPVQAMLGYATSGIAAKAKGNLAAHRHDGHSYIEIGKGRIDRYVILNDTRGQAAAMSIEMGRGDRTPEDPKEAARGGMDGLHILHRAAGIDVERTFPRSKRRKEFYE